MSTQVKFKYGSYGDLSNLKNIEQGALYLANNKNKAAYLYYGYTNSQLLPVVPDITEKNITSSSYTYNLIFAGENNLPYKNNGIRFTTGKSEDYFFGSLWLGNNKEKSEDKKYGAIRIYSKGTTYCGL